MSYCWNTNLSGNDLDKCQCDKPGFCIRHCIEKNSSEYRKCRFSQDVRTSLDFPIYGDRFSNVPLPIRGSIQNSIAKLKTLKKSDSLVPTTIFVVGHSACIPEMDTCMEYFNLEEEDYGEFSKYATPDLAEARFYFSSKALPKTEAFGSLTASWNKKFSGQNRLESFQSWEASRYLPNVVLCAHRGIFHPYIDNEYFRGFLEDRGLNTPVGLGVWANQIVCSGELFTELTLFMRKALVDLVKLNAKHDILRGNLDPKYYQKTFSNRVIALFAEEISARWFASKKDLIIISCEKIKPSWYGDWSLPSSYRA
jgi:hypothetical protein